jgi:hypothetical protein
MYFVKCQGFAVRGEGLSAFKLCVGGAIVCGLGRQGLKEVKGDMDDVVERCPVGVLIFLEECNESGPLSRGTSFARFV